MYLLLLIGLFTLSFTIGLSGALSPGPLLIVTIDSSLRKGWSGGILTVLGHFLVEAPLIVALAYGIGFIMNNNIIKLTITITGSCALLAFGGYTAYSSRQTEFVEPRPTPSSSNGRHLLLTPIFSGIIATATNPFYWIWWVTIGLAMLTYAPLIVMANILPLIYSLSLCLLFNILSFTPLSQLAYALYILYPSYFFMQFSFLLDFNYLFLGSTFLGWALIAIGHFFSDLTWYTLVSVAIAKSKSVISVKWYRRIMLVCGLSLAALGVWFLVSPPP